MKVYRVGRRQRYSRYGVEFFYVVSILSDENGISESSYSALLDALDFMGMQHFSARLQRIVDATDGRFYISDPEELGADFWEST